MFTMTSSGIDENDGGFFIFFIFLRGGAIGLVVISARVSVSLLWDSYSTRIFRSLKQPYKEKKIDLFLLEKEKGFYVLYLIASPRIIMY